MTVQEADFVVIGAGSAGCAVAYGLAQAGVGTVAVLEAGGSDAALRVKVPFGLLFTMGSRRDWRFTSAPQGPAQGRRIRVNRGKMLGGSSSINSMVWFRGRQDDFDGWGVPGWGWSDVQGAFEAVEQHMRPNRLPDPHPLSEAFGRSLGSNGLAPPTPERESAGVFHVNMLGGRRWSAADAFLRPALASGRVQVIPRAEVDRIALEEGQARQVLLADGRRITARRGIVLSAGSIGSPAILMRSGIGPGAHLQTLGIPVHLDAPGVGGNLHDHPAVGVHHAGAGSGYGLTLAQLPAWALSPLHWLLRRRGRMTSNFVEAGAFIRARPDEGPPDIQVHFIPYMMGHQGRQIVPGSGYYADICLCRPVSRGRLRLSSARAGAAPEIDLGLLTDPSDLDLMVAGLKRLRQILALALFETRAAPEVFPADAAQTDAEIADYVCARCGTAYHPVGTLRMGAGGQAPVTPGLALRGVGGIWVADASVMPKITSANTNAPSIMIGHRAAQMISEAL